MFKLRPVTFRSPPLRSGDISISSAQIRRRDGGFAISLLSSSLRWRCGGGFCSGSFLVWIENLVFCGFWFVFLVWVCCGVVGIANGFVGFAGSRWVVIAGFVDSVLRERERGDSAKRKEQRTKKNNNNNGVTNRLGKRTKMVTFLNVVDFIGISLNLRFVEFTPKKKKNCHTVLLVPSPVKSK